SQRPVDLHRRPGVGIPVGAGRRIPGVRHRARQGRARDVQRGLRAGGRPRARLARRRAHLHAGGEGQGQALGDLAHAHLGACNRESRDRRDDAEPVRPFRTRARHGRGPGGNFVREHHCRHHSGRREPRARAIPARNPRRSRLVAGMRGQAGPARSAMAATRALRPDPSASPARGGGIGPSTRLDFAVVGSACARHVPQDIGQLAALPSIALTLTPGTLIVASAYPDPPFDLTENGSASGFDIELMRAICAQLGLVLQPVRYSGDDFNGIFDGLANRSYDAVISGTTITPDRSAIALFSQSYLEFNQGVAVNRRSPPKVASHSDLRCLTAGIQSGNTSDLVARRLLAEGAIADIKYYPYHGIAAALDDLEAGRIGLVIKLHPVISWLVKGRPALSVALEVPTHEKLGIAFAKQN